jgi:multisubunit Na+/H+ antiporter MnhB subunit
MSISSATDLALVLLILSLASWIIASKTTYRAVIGFVVYGLMLALVWMRLGAADVALTEAALGGGLTGLLLLGAAARLSRFDGGLDRGGIAGGHQPGLGLRLLTGVLCAAVAAGLAAIVLLLPEPAPSLAQPVAAALPETGVGNPVTAVLLAYRAIDTLLEAVVLVPAMIAVWSLAADQAWSGRPGFLIPARPSSTLSLLAQLLPPIGIVFGIHLLWIGADHPGGKFQAAAVLAAMWALVLLAGLRYPPRVTGLRLRLAVVLGPLVFIAIGVSGIWLADAFLAYPEGYAKPLIIVIETVLTLSIAVALIFLLAGPPTAEPPSEAES